jgi:succinylglutamate desuccinylase
MFTSFVTTRTDGVWCVHSNVRGPHLGFVGGVHGNEQAGILLVTRLRDAFQNGDLHLLRGTLTLAHGNLEAIKTNTRSTALGRDLNRCFTRAVMQPNDDTPESRRARELAIALKSVRIGIDLHATNLPSTPFLMMQAPEGHHAKAVLPFLRAQILLTDPNWIFAGGPSTLDEFLGRGCRIGICYETGFATDLSRVDEIEHELLDLLRHFGMIAGSPRDIPRPAQERYELVQAIVPAHDGFTFVREEDLANFRTVTSGDVLGYDARTPIIAKHDGVLVFPKAIHLRQQGKPAGYLARRI